MEIKNIVRNCTPPVLLKFVKKITGNHSAVPKKAYYCPVCDNSVAAFSPLPGIFDEMLDKYQYIHSVHCTETINSRAYSCPYCYASDRERLYVLYLQERFEKLKNTGQTYRFLNIAPSQSAAFIKKQVFIRYRSADLYMENVDDKVDITDMNIYEDNCFDMLLCSHVLEHIEEDRKAMSELYRVLKPSGFGIIMVPINLELKEDFENPAYKTEAERWKYFGQNDHVRLYSKSGFVNKLTKTGFKVNQYGIDYFGEETFERNGIHPRSVLYVVEK
ncbi:SAM-dependent methyltransferase [Bacteroidia bacterium]|nr:SAM-dependent methyltransferase [Bacteroidia bacterium]